MARTAATMDAPVAAPIAEGERPKRRKLLLLVIGAVVLAGLGAAAAFFFLLSDDEAAAEPPPVVEGEVVEVAQMTLNLAGPQTHYARVSFAAVLEEKADAEKVKLRFPLVKDAVITEVGTFTAEVLRTPEGVEQLRERLTERVVGLYPEGEVVRVVFTELVVQ
jgi:flagellar protein FliL